MNSDVAALYIQSLNAALTSLGMIMVGYQAGLAESKRTLAMPIQAVAFVLVIGLIGSLDHPVGGFTLTAVSQHPLIDLLSDIDEQRLGMSFDSVKGR